MRIAIAHHQDCDELRRLLATVPGYQIAWVARTGNDTVARCKHDRPDLLVMNLLLPDLDSAEVTRRIMRDSPCPILLLANSVDTNVAKIFAAMGQGAKDVISLPETGDSAEARKSREVLLKKVRNLAALHHGDPSPAAPAKGHAPLRDRAPKLVVIGASTGGPGALAKLLSALPGSLDAAIVVIQHVDEEFSFDLAAWLNSQVALEVHLAKAGEYPHAGHIYVASSNDHLVFSAGLKFAYTPDPRSTHYRPSVDVFFDSVARFWPTPHIAVLLTGMGRDGAAGLATLRGKGWHTIAQDQATCVVYGMPKAAKELDAAVEILPLSNIAPTIVRRLAETKGA